MLPPLNPNQISRDPETRLSSTKTAIIQLYLPVAYQSRLGHPQWSEPVLIVGSLSGIAVIIGQVGQDLKEKGGQGPENKHPQLEPVFGIPEETSQGGGRYCQRKGAQSKCLEPYLGSIHPVQN